VPGLEYVMVNFDDDMAIEPVSSLFPTQQASVEDLYQETTW
jgi:hypothetical protein